MNDIRLAIRTLMKNPAFVIVAVMMLGAGIGINVAVFSVTNAVFFKAFPKVVDNDRLVYIDTQLNGRGCCVSYPDFEDWRAQAKSFTGLAAVADLRVALVNADGFAESYNATQVTASTFQLLGQRPIIGRDFSASDEVVGGAPVVILSYGFWERRYGRDAAIVGQSIHLNGIPTTVIGVMPSGFSFPKNQDMWVPVVPTPDFQKREARRLWFAVGRLANGVDATAAHAELETIASRLATAYPQTNAGSRLRVRTFREFFIGPNATIMYASLLGAVAFVLLIACANLANLLLARAIGRSREMSVRIALGAGRWRIVRQLLVESMIVSALGGLVGWWVAVWALHLYQLTPNQPIWFEHVLDYQIDYHVLGYLLIVTIVTGLLFGLAPALRLSKLDVNAGLKEGGRGAAGGSRSRRLASMLVTAEVALAIVLLAAAGVMIRSFLNVYSASLGVDTSNVLTMFLSLPDTTYPRPGSQIDFFDQLSTRLRGIPGVQSVAIALRPPTGGSLVAPYEVIGTAPTDDQRRPTVAMLVIGQGYFRTLGAQVLAGREFDDRDGATNGGPVAVVNERFVREHWPGEDPTGKRIRLFDQGGSATDAMVVGEVSNIVQNDLTRQNAEPLVYVPYKQRPGAGMWLFVKTRVPPASITMACRREIQALDADMPIWLGPFTLSERVDQGSSSNSQIAMLFSVFGAIALLLTSFGLYAVIAHTVSQRTQEICIRMAVGATASDIVRLVFSQGMLPLAGGLSLGVVASVAVNRVLSSQLVHVSPADPIALALASGALIAAGALGCLLPAWRAMRLDPVTTLRRD